MIQIAQMSFSTVRIAPNQEDGKFSPYIYLTDKSCIIYGDKERNTLSPVSHLNPESVKSLKSALAKGRADMRKMSIEIPILNFHNSKESKQTRWEMKPMYKNAFAPSPELMKFELRMHMRFLISMIVLMRVFLLDGTGMSYARFTFGMVIAMIVFVTTRHNILFKNWLLIGSTIMVIGTLEARWRLPAESSSPKKN